jgi:hypothetical protein
MYSPFIRSTSSQPLMARSESELCCTPSRMLLSQFHQIWVCRQPYYSSLTNCISATAGDVDDREAGAHGTQFMDVRLPALISGKCEQQVMLSYTQPMCLRSYNQTGTTAALLVHAVCGAAACCQSATGHHRK